FAVYVFARSPRSSSVTHNKGWQISPEKPGVSRFLVPQVALCGPARGCGRVWQPPTALRSAGVPASAIGKLQHRQVPPPRTTHPAPGRPGGRGHLRAWHGPCVTPGWGPGPPRGGTDSCTDFRNCRRHYFGLGYRTLVLNNDLALPGQGARTPFYVVFVEV